MEVRNSGQISEASLDVLEDIDLNQVSPEVSAHLGTLKQNLSTTTGLCSERTLPAVAVAAAAKVRRTHGSLIGQAPGASGSPPQSPVPSSQVPSGSRTAKRKIKESKIHQCHICGAQKTRKSDMDYHLSVEHQIGTPRKCNICGKLLKFKAGVKQHIRNVHKKEFNYKCAEEDCTYGSDSEQAF